MLTRMKRSISCVLLLAATAAVGETQASTECLSETWDAVASLPTADWLITSEDGSHLPYVEDTNGNPPPCVRIGGGVSSQRGGLWHGTFTPKYVGRTLTLSTDAFIGNSSTHFVDLHFGLFDPNGAPTNDADRLVFFNFNNNAGDQRIGVQLSSADPDHNESVWLDTPYPANVWFNARLVVRPDQRVEAWIDDTLLWTSTKTVDPALDGFAKLFFAGHESTAPVRIDNLEAASELSETWDAVTSLPTTEWLITSEDASHFPYVEDTDGNPAPCVRIGGGGGGQRGALWYDPLALEYVGGTLTLSTDAFIGSSGTHFVDLHFGLFDPTGVPTNDADRLVLFNFNNNAGDQRIGVQLVSANPDHSESVWLETPYPADVWFNAKLVIRCDLHVEAWVDHTLLWTSTRTLDPALHGLAKLFFAGHESSAPVRVDNFQHQVRCACTSAAVPTVSTWGMAAMLLLLLTAGTVVFVHRRGAGDVEAPLANQ